MSKRAWLLRSFSAAFLLSAVAVAGCDPGFSTEDAEERCDQEQEARDNGGCFERTTYAECVAAYEECGDEVEIAESCPLHYVCPAD